MSSLSHYLYIFYPEIVTKHYFKDLEIGTRSGMRCSSFSLGPGTGCQRIKSRLEPGYLRCGSRLGLGHLGFRLGLDSKRLDLKTILGLKGSWLGIGLGMGMRSKMGHFRLKQNLV